MLRFLPAPNRSCVRPAVLVAGAVACLAAIGALVENSRATEERHAPAAKTLPHLPMILTANEGQWGEEILFVARRGSTVRFAGSSFS